MKLMGTIQGPGTRSQNLGTESHNALPPNLYCETEVDGIYKSSVLFNLQTVWVSMNYRELSITKVFRRALHGPNKSLVEWPDVMNSNVG